MKAVRCFDDLREYGIVPLTGEACGLSCRILCDLTAAGKRIVEKALGVQISAEAWNHGSDDDPHVASVMLTQDMVASVGVQADLVDVLADPLLELWPGYAHDGAI